MKRTPEQIKAWRDGLKAISAKVRALPEAERERLAMEYGTINERGHRLSGFNCVFLMMQAGRPLAQVAGFNKWKAIGRQVIKGQKAIGYIWYPMNRANADDIDPDTGKKARMSFGTAPVFDITQTELI